MDELKFNDIEYNYVEVNSFLPEVLQKNIKTKFLKPGDCLINSHTIVNQNDKIKMVEGFLITEFEGQSFESVGHVWCKYDGEYFDLSKDLITPNKEVKNFYYFVSCEYCIDDISTQEKIKPSSNIYALATEKYIVFKSNVKIIEKDLRDFLNDKKNHANDLA
jgi:hypothetical protein